jgi:hypothetical protein
VTEGTRDAQDTLSGRRHADAVEPTPTIGSSLVGRGAEHHPTSSIDARVSLAQGIYYAATGVWPLVSMKTFERVTGPKRDRWLVKTVGLLITAVGVTLVHAGRRRRVHEEIGVLGALSAAALATVDVVYVARRVISPVYLLDAVPEMLLLGWWSGRLARSSSEPGAPAARSRGPRERPSTVSPQSTANPQGVGAERTASGPAAVEGSRSPLSSPPSEV